MRFSLPILALVAAMGTNVAADDFGGWRFTVPKDYKSTSSENALVLQKVAPPTFCLMVLYAARAMTQPLATEAASEWKSHVAGTFKTTGVKHHGDGTTKSSIAFTATAGTIENGSDKVSVILYTVSSGRSVGSVLLSSNTVDTLAACRPALTELLDSLTLAPATAPAPAPAPAPRPAPSESIAGRWATSSASESGEWGSVKRQYTFAADGTYRFYSEAWGGKYNSKRWRLISETGTYTVSGAKLTITPVKATGVEKNDTITKPFNVAIEKATYTWQRHYFEGIKEWDLVMTTPTKIQRDGEFANNDQFPSSYMYSEKYMPDWTNPP